MKKQYRLFLLATLLFFTGCQKSLPVPDSPLDTSGSFIGSETGGENTLGEKKSNSEQGVFDFEFLTGEESAGSTLEDGSPDIYQQLIDEFSSGDGVDGVADLADDIATLNHTLSGTPYSFKEMGNYERGLYRGDTLLYSGFLTLFGFQQHGEQIVFCVERGICLVNGNLEKNHASSWNYAPQFDEQGNVYTIIAQEEGQLHSVFKNDEQIFTFEPILIQGYPLHSFFVNKDGWSIVYDREAKDFGEVPFETVLIHNGENLSDQNGWQEVFGLHPVADQLFYFYKKEGKIGYARGNNFYETPFEEISHSDFGYGAINLVRNQNDVLIHAKKEGKRGRYQAVFKKE